MSDAIEPGKTMSKHPAILYQDNLIGLIDFKIISIDTFTIFESKYKRCMNITSIQIILVIQQK